MEFEQEITVEAAVEQAFRACADVEEHIHWMASLVEVELDREQEVRAGMRFRQVHEVSGMRQEFEGEVLEYVPNQRIRTRLEHKDLILTTDLNFEALGEGCRIKQHSEIELLSFALRVMKGAISNGLTKRFHEDFARLKARLETNEPR